MSDLDMPHDPPPAQNERIDPRDYVARVDTFLGAPTRYPLSIQGQ